MGKRARKQQGKPTKPIKHRKGETPRNRYFLYQKAKRHQCGIKTRVITRRNNNNINAEEKQ